MADRNVDVHLTGSLEPYRAALAAARRSTMTTPQLTPWRRTLRTVFQAILALAVLAPFLATTAGLDPAQLPWLAGFLAVAATITRIMAMPQVEAFLQRFLPWLAAKDQRGVAELTVIAVCAVVVAIIAVLWLFGVVHPNH